ncbi:hypothetical protein [Actinacidiphila oryziradicis]|uniref:Uncharacterized protein n=1 Tax=Actinacidiphila oryziradicis TaxID=2571141 RepID=A0A4U0SH69_9ACTN|nr:hypothetical protein [Actinacidiphila oryziradicis]TKA08383.1 hypothetical protein FCI23_28240 [Actinacidiphila oryziradicis]
MPYATDARRIGDHVAAELQLTFAEAGFWLEARGAVPISVRAYVDIAPIPAEVAARLIERVREWAAR